jgi:hypothetical protein
MMVLAAVNGTRGQLWMPATSTMLRGVMPTRTTTVFAIVVAGCGGVRVPANATQPAPVAIPAAAEPSFRPVERGDWALAWSKTETTQTTVLGAPGMLVRPAPGARRVVVPRSEVTHPTGVITEDPPVDPTMDPFFGGGDLADANEALSLSPGDVLAYPLSEAGPSAELSIRGEGAVRVWWTPAFAGRTATISAGVMTQKDEVRFTRVPRGAFRWTSGAARAYRRSREDHRALGRAATGPERVVADDAGSRDIGREPASGARLGDVG